nr:MAG TPA: hypothetical protein [Caudoviricetes sp.]
MNRTRTTFLLDSLASYWNTFIPYRQIIYWQDLVAHFLYRPFNQALSPT